MNLFTYFGLALISMEMDALASYATDTKYRPFVSAIMALFWPVTCWLAIGGVIKVQKQEDPKPSGGLPLPRCNKCGGILAPEMHGMDWECSQCGKLQEFSAPDSGRGSAGPVVEKDTNP